MWPRKERLLALMYALSALAPALVAASNSLSAWRHGRRARKQAQAERQEVWLQLRVSRRKLLHGEEDPRVAEAIADLADFYVERHRQGLTSDRALFEAEFLYSTARAVLQRCQDNACAWQERLAKIDLGLKYLSAELDRVMPVDNISA